jgi:hypothetical protein
LRNNTQLFFGNKKYKGETVISKLNEGFFKKMESKNKNVVSIIPRSFEIPTDRILDLLKDNKTKDQERDNIIRPVDLERWLYPASVFIGLGFLFRLFNPFVLSIFIFSVFLHAEEIKLSEKSIQGIEMLKNNKLNPEQKIRLADQLSADGAVEMARSLYQEELKDKNAKLANPESVFNWATMELQQKDLSQGLKLYKEILDQIEKDPKHTNPELKEKIDQNTKKLFSAQNQQKNKDNKDQKEDNQDQKDETKNQDQKNNDQNKDDSQGQSKDSQKNKNGSQSKEDDKENPFDPKNKDKEEKKKEEPKQDPKEQEGKPKDGEEKKDQEKDSQNPPPDGERKEKKKLSPLLEQLKSDDRKLQMKLLDTGTQDKKNRPKRDW